MRREVKETGRRYIEREGRASRSRDSLGVRDSYSSLEDAVELGLIEQLRVTCFVGL